MLKQSTRAFKPRKTPGREPAHVLEAMRRARLWAVTPDTERGSGTAWWDAIRGPAWAAELSCEGIGKYQSLLDACRTAAA
jgi:hypothetical protein